MKPQNKNDIIKLIKENSGKIRSYGIDKIGLFGSFARNKPRDDSDVDLLIEFNKDKKTYDNFINFAYFIESLLKRKVELVTPESVSPYIAPYIRKEVEYVKILN